MKETTKLNKIIEDVITAKKKYFITPEQNRYIDKRVREQMNLQMQNIPKKLPDYLNAAETHVFINKAYEYNNFTGLLVEFLIFTGLRISEGNNLQIYNIDFYNNQIKVVQGKGSKDRYVPLSVGLANKIKLFLNGRIRGTLFANPRNYNHKYSIRNLQTKIENVIKKCAFTKKLSTHSLRHTFACMCLAKGIPIEQIKLIMGHSSVKTTEIYAKLELGTIKEDFLRLMGV